MRKHVSSILALGAVCATLGAAVFAVGAQAATRHFDATVISKDPGAKTVRVLTQSATRLTIKVNSRTVFERIGGGFGGLAKGMAIEIEATNSSGSWVAIKIEQRSGSGGHGGGHDDGPGHT
jgi:hypothetical protein